MILVLALLSLRRFFCLDLGLCIIAVDCVKRWKEWGEAGGEGRVRGGLPLNCDQNTIVWGFQWRLRITCGFAGGMEERG